MELVLMMSVSLEDFCFSFTASALKPNLLKLMGRLTSQVSESVHEMTFLHSYMYIVTVNYSFTFVGRLEPEEI